MSPFPTQDSGHADPCSPANLFRRFHDVSQLSHTNCREERARDCCLQQLKRADERALMSANLVIVVVIVVIEVLHVVAAGGSGVRVRAPH